MRALGALLLLPMALSRLPAVDYNVWALFSVLAGLQLLVDMGFCLTFVRAIASALGGAPSMEAFRRHSQATTLAVPNWELLTRVAGFMRFIYARLGWVYLGLVGVGGTFALIIPISATRLPEHAWAAWVVVVLCGYVGMRASYLGILLQGLNEIALVRRWEAVTAFCSAISGCIVLYFNGSLLALVIATQLWVVVGAARNFWLCRGVAGGRFAVWPSAKHDGELLKILWPPTWRSGVGVLMSFGLIQATGLVQAQFVSAASSASYLLCLRILQQVSAFSQAPFYSKLALLPRLRTENRKHELLEVAGRGIRQSLWAYAIGFAVAGLCGPALLRLIGSDVSFPAPETIIIFGALFGIERYAAMYLNLYNITNDIITHVANGATGVICIGCIMALYSLVGELAIPLGLLGGYLLFYSWYPVWRAYREFGMVFWSFEARNSLGPFLLFVVAAAVIWMRS